MAQSIFRSTTIRVENAASFVKKFYPQGGPLIGDNHLYVMIGRENNPVGMDPVSGSPYGAAAGLWPDDGVPPLPTDTRRQDRVFWSMAIGGKHVDPTDISLMVPRKATTDWASGNEYEVYSESNSTLYTANNFYVMNQFFEVFILVRKSESATTSLTEPVFFNTYDNPVTRPNLKVDGAAGTIFFNDGKQSIIETAEGYTWKYMYTLQSESIVDLLQPEWLPVNYGITRWSNESDPRFLQSQDSIDTSGEDTGYANKILGARYVLVRALLDTGLSGSGLLPAGLNYRQIALVENPISNASGARATFSVGVQPNTIVPGGATNRFTINSGDVIYIENKSPVFRAVDQSEEFKVALVF